MQNGICKNWPAGQKRLPSEVTEKLGALLANPTITGTAELVHVANATLAKAITEQSKITSKKYRDTLMQFLSGSAPAGHALLNGFAVSSLFLITRKKSKVTWMDICLREVTLDDLSYTY